MLDGRDLQLLSNLLDQKLKPIQEDISVLKVEMKECLYYLNKVCEE